MENLDLSNLGKYPSSTDKLTILKFFTTPNRDTSKNVDVKYVVLHDTEETLFDTISIFLDPTKSVSAHYVISREGQVFELATVSGSQTDQTGHAGKSAGNSDINLNDTAIGIELVSQSSYLMDYTNEQYAALNLLLNYLKNIFPCLNEPSAIVGHEHIGGFSGHGKRDPNYRFNWTDFFKTNYPTQEVPKRPYLMPKKTADWLATKIDSYQAQIAACQNDPDKIKQVCLAFDSELAAVHDDSYHAGQGPVDPEKGTQFVLSINPPYDPNK